MNEQSLKKEATKTIQRHTFFSEILRTSEILHNSSSLRVNLSKLTLH